MSVVIPNDILTASGLSEDELKLEIAIMLFKQDKISIGKARHLAGMNLLQFQHELNLREICVHYDLEELEEDIQTLQKLGDPNAPPYKGTDPIVRRRLGLPPIES